MLQSFLPDNFILAADSYKTMHWAQMPKDTAYVQSCLVPRKGEEIVVVGTRILALYLASVSITNVMIDEAELEINEQGYEFNRAGWEAIRDAGGKLPLEMLAVPEGTVVPANTAIVMFQNTIPFTTAFLPSYVETIAQCVIQKMTTVATQCRKGKKDLIDLAKRSGMDVAGVQYKLHNFGDRGADAPEAASIAALSHAVFFSGSDCMGVNRLIKKAYNTKKAYTSSIDAAEHSTMCMNSAAVTKNDYGAAVMAVEMLERAVIRAKNGIGVPMISAPIDTYDSHHFSRDFICGKLKDRIIASGGTFVQRPDSGDPMVEPITIVKITDEGVGHEVNNMGFRVLHPAFRVIQGDGINFESMPLIGEELLKAGYSLDNLTFGMGGGLTHGEGRDKYSFSQKSVSWTSDATDPYNAKNTWIDLLKEPKTDIKKKSLSGYLRTFHNETTGEIKTVAFKNGSYHGVEGFKNIMDAEFLNGSVRNYLEFGKDAAFDIVRERANIGL